MLESIKDDKNNREYSGSFSRDGNGVNAVFPINYNPQNEMFDNRKTKRCIFKTKRIFSVSPPFIKTM
jgi:uncharacterized protein YkuJ